jgi:hypothetical protein
MPACMATTLGTNTKRARGLNKANKNPTSSSKEPAARALDQK